MSGSPPVQALKRYQAGFALRFAVSSPAERQNWQLPPSSVQVNHQAPPIRHSAGARRASRRPAESWFAWPCRPRSQRVGPLSRPPAQLGHVDRRRGVVVGAHDPAQVVDLGPHRLGPGDVGVQGDAVEVGLDVAAPGRSGRGSRPRRRWAGSAAAGRRGRRGSPWRRGRRGAGSRPEMRIRVAKAAGSGRSAKVTMFSSFQISQRRIGRNGSSGCSSQKEPSGP